MDLRHLYKLSEIIIDNIDKEELPEDMMEDMEITLKYNPNIFYGIDKEFYYITHGNSYGGFVHSENEINAKVNGINFKILPKKETIEEKVEKN